MQIDPNATLIAIVVVIAVLGLQMLVFWVRDRNAPWLGTIAFTLLLAAAGLLCYLLPAKGMEFVTYGAGNALRLAAFALLWQNTRIFNGRRPELLGAGLVISIWMALCSVPAFLFSFEARVCGASIFTAFFLLLSAHEMWRGRAEFLPSRLPAALVLVSYAMIIMLRLPLLRSAPFPMGALPMDGLWLAIFGVISFAHASFFVAFTLSMTRERSEQEQRKYAISDPLTGLLNRRAFIEDSRRGSRRRWREGLALLVLDLDHFKSVNDRFGHDAGDQTLQNFARIARQSVRAGDLLYRIGGEEFCFVLPGASPEDAVTIAERIRRSFAASILQRGTDAIACTVSIGVAVANGNDTDAEALFARGDEAVYAAKANGRNRTVVAGMPRTDTPLPLKAAA